VVRKIAVTLLSERQKRTRLARELAKLNPAEERELAEEGVGADQEETLTVHRLQVLELLRKNLWLEDFRN